MKYLNIEENERVDMLREDEKAVAVYYVDNEKFDYKKFMSILFKNKKIIFLITFLVLFLASLYIILSTKWWQIDVTLEIGQYIDIKTEKITYLEDGKHIVDRLNALYISSHKYEKNRNVKIISIEYHENNPQLITIVGIGKSEKIILDYLTKMINNLKNRHKIILNRQHAINIAKINIINNDIFYFKHGTIENINKEIKEIKQIYIPIIEGKIKTINENINKSTIIKRKFDQNIILNKSNDSSMAGLILLQLKELEGEILHNKLLINDLEKDKKLLTRKVFKMQREIQLLNKSKLTKLKETKKLMLARIERNNFFNTRVLGNFVLQDKPIKPKILLILIFSFIIGILLSVIFILAKNQENSEFIVGIGETKNNVVDNES